MKTVSTPAFWDLHLHGVAGIDFMTAVEGEMVHACERLGAKGTGFFSPTLLTAEPLLLREACTRWGAFLSRASKKNFLKKSAATPLGLHLEGPFLSPNMAGAHPKGALQKPSLTRATDLIARAAGHVAIVTLAPELPGALALTKKLSSQGIRVQLGHTLASSSQALRATRAGATGLTHLFNAMRIHHRNPGVLTPLRRGLLTAEIITDGLHLDPEFVMWCCQATPDQLYAVSDGCSAIQAPPRKRLTLGSLKIERHGKAALVAGSGILAGGATYLTEHPAVFGNLGVRPDFLKMFYARQQSFFPGLRPGRSRCNHFDAKTLRYLGSES